MERLDLSKVGAYSALEASIHVARYALVRDLCRGKKVLDVACGEGYGSRLMLDWGAAKVVGVDVSPEAVTRATAQFQDDRLSYICGDAQTVDRLLPGEQFDLIVSLETIEHLSQPDEFLQSLQRLRAQDAVVCISCPNDWWYYPEAHTQNPYHIRKYTFDEFLDLVTPVLGKPDCIQMGLPVAGFMNCSWSNPAEAKPGETQMAMMRLSDANNTLLVPSEHGATNPVTASYFVACWGGQVKGAAIFAAPMDLFRNGFYSGSLEKALAEESVIGRKLKLIIEGKERDVEWKLAQLQKNNEQKISQLEMDSEQKISQLERELKSARVRHASLLVENETIRRHVSRMQADCERLKIAAQRYFYIRSRIPPFILRLVRGARRIVGKAAKYVSR